MCSCKSPFVVSGSLHALFGSTSAISRFCKRLFSTAVWSVFRCCCYTGLTENAGHETAGHENTGHEFAIHDKYLMKIYCITVQCAFLLNF